MLTRLSSCASASTGIGPVAACLLRAGIGRCPTFRKPVVEPSNIHSVRGSAQNRSFERDRAVMPLLARFYGILVRVWWSDHPPPHIHVYYAEHQASISIETLEILTGQLPRRVKVLVLEWTMQHRDDLRAAWAAAQRREPPGQIGPLD
jgi:hypothetical protein